MCDGPSAYLAKRERRRQAEYEYWNSPEMQDPKGRSICEEKSELEIVRCTLQTVERGMNGSETWDGTKKCYCRLVDYGILEQAVEALRRYEKLLSKEPLVEQIANDWRKAGTFYEGPEGIA